jgi:membrane-associated phospholipid phosphatase
MRPAAISIIAVFFSLVPLVDRAPAQGGINEQQRKAYAKQFQAGGPIAGRATPAERRTLLRAQEMRMTVPADTQKFGAFLKSSPSFQALSAGLTPELGYLLSWNEVALQASALDHYTPNANNPPPTFGEQYGPARSSRAFAIVHLAMFEAVNTISRKFQSYRNLQATIVQNVGVPVSQINATTASKNRALVEAGYQTLVALYPNKKPLFDNARDLSLAQLGLPNDPAIILGTKIGAQAAAAVLNLRMNDGSQLPDLSASDFNTNPVNSLYWHQDPITQLPVALGGNWPRVTPFLLASGDAFRSVLRDPRGMNPDPTRNIPTTELINAYKSVKTLGGDPNAPMTDVRWPTLTTRTGASTPDHPTMPYNKDQTFIGIFWAYDGSALLCAPPRLYNMIATSVALNEKPITTVEEMSAYLALINVTMADAGIAAWDGKYFYCYPRPVTFIREASVDSTPEGTSEPSWTPLGGQVTNGLASGRNLTPPFPAYPSGHAVFGAALFEAMKFYYTSLDSHFPPAGVAFTFVSDEYNGFNRGPGNTTPRDKAPASFQCFDEARKMNAQSRIYLGIHWQFDADDGVKLGTAVGHDVSMKFLHRLP